MEELKIDAYTRSIKLFNENNTNELKSNLNDLDREIN